MANAERAMCQIRTTNRRTLRHHERRDGQGYPRGLKGDEIPLISRIILVAEAYDRVVHQGDLPPDKRKAASLQVIREGSGKQFDPNIAKSLIFLNEMEGG